MLKQSEVPTPTSLVVQSQQGKKHFIFDHVFDADTSQEGIWNYVRDSVPSFVQGYNVFYTGFAGVGKSTVLKNFVKRLEGQNKKIDIVAPSGIAVCIPAIGDSQALAIRSRFVGGHLALHHP